MSLKGYKIIAGIVSIATLFVMLLAPMFIYAALTNISWEDNTPIPDWLIWFIILGGAIGAGLLVPIHKFIICKIGGFPTSAATISW
ncbi:hypothetical protein [Aliiglaciecola sp. M165]|uniref:hypothetical protein n=1 Tax=Aliiglaciecola sp. M165 TaxID=2593649 RepID=UPI00117F6D23|nr:hypothetical protein [Aliiglaciecola sp. M165]TRY28673.1 hypothetical protein FM019_20650 [Aliiglaciecola sp. M165]